MLTRLDRYLLREIALAFVAVTIVLLGLVLTHRLGLYLNQATSGLLAKTAILQLLGLQAIRYLVILIPLAMLLAIMLALGRLYRDSEIVAVSACGYGPRDFYRPLALLALPLLLLLGALAFWVSPKAMALHLALQDRARQDAELSLFTPGAFREVARGRYVIYVGGIDGEARELRDIFVQTHDLNGVSITTAQRGYQQIEPDSGARFIVLHQGRRYEGQPGYGDYRSIEFQRLSTRIDSPPREQLQRRREAIPTGELLATDSPIASAELHRRLAVPLSLLVVMFIAPLVAKAKPREGRYSRIFAAIMLYVIYHNLLHLGEIWLKTERAWEALGLWWVHGLFLLVGVSLWLAQYGPPRFSHGRHRLIAKA